MRWNWGSIARSWENGEMVKMGEVDTEMLEWISRLTRIDAIATTRIWADRSGRDLGRQNGE